MAFPENSLLRRKNSLRRGENSLRHFPAGYQAIEFFQRCSSLFSHFFPAGREFRMLACGPLKKGKTDV